VFLSFVFLTLLRCNSSSQYLSLLTPRRKKAEKMGCFGSKDKLSKEDMDFLKSHTRYDETTIKEWYKGFKVNSARAREREN
jgi:hypothetical protein